MRRRWKQHRNHKPAGNNQRTFQAYPSSDHKHRPLPSDIEEMKARLKQIFGHTSDLQLEDITLSGKPAMLAYLSTMTDAALVAEKILEPLIAAPEHQELSTASQWQELGKRLFSGSRHSFTINEVMLVERMLSGSAGLMVDGQESALIIMIDEVEKRSIAEPSTQTVIRGPKDGFIESIDINMSLLRRRIKNPSLRFEQYILGKETKTTVQIGYIDGIANHSIVEEVRQRIKETKPNAIFESANVEEFITDKTMTPFPLVYNTERPDTVAAHLTSGKVAVLVDGTPFVLTMPCVFTNFLVAQEDYYQPFHMSSFIRGIRYLSFMLALLLPSLYVSVITYHHEMIPTPLIISIIAQREGIPFPAFIEVLIMETIFEILREAGVRMPRAVGGTISIVGGLVIGQAAVEAGIISYIMVIVVALTAIASFVSPVYSFSIAARLLRFVYVILASVFGLYGVFLGMIIMVAHLASLRSFGIPYLAPVAPIIAHDQKNTLIRVPLWAERFRPLAMRTEAPLKQPAASSDKEAKP